MRIALAQINFHVGNFDYNVGRMLAAIDNARRQGADMVVFSELSVCGYPPRDLLLSAAFIEQCQAAVSQVAAGCTDIAAIVGGPDPNARRGGKSLYNAAFLLYGGQVQQVYHKGLLPTYDVFNEYRYFEPARTFRTIVYGGERIALTVCEDIWNLDGQGIYPVNPPDILNKENPSLMINISASPFAWSHVPGRMQIMSENALKYRVPLFTANLVGGQTDLIFDGASSVFNSSGQLVDMLPMFGEDLRTYDLTTLETAKTKAFPGKPGAEEKSRLIYDALVLGVRDYFRKTGQKKAIIGLSGGIDSAVTLVIAAEALGKENVWAVLLPGPYSTEHSITDALALARNLDIRHDTISINDAVSSMENSLAVQFQGTRPGIAEENIQARARAVLLMGLSNKFGYLLLNTSNKSEAAVGYSTLYGDMCGGLSVLGDVYKTDVYSLARLINANGEVIPENTINKPPSAELKPDQKDTDSLPEYPVLDGILHCLFEKQMDGNAIVGEGHDRILVRKVLNMVYGSEYKRHQTPPILRVSSKCLGAGREMPLDAAYGTLDLID